MCLSFAEQWDSPAPRFTTSVWMVAWFKGLRICREEFLFGHYADLARPVPYLNQGSAHR
jgi:hypothetical protein